jgi:hypothetical protein
MIQRRALLLVLLAAIFIAVLMYDPDPEPFAMLPEGSYFGFWMPYTAGIIDEAAVIEMENLIGKDYAMQMVFFDIKEDPYLLNTRLKQLKRLQKTPVVILELHLPPPVLQSIIDGGQDRRLKRIASVIRAHKQPVFLRFGHEMNGNWYPWSGLFNGADEDSFGSSMPDGPERYVLAWQHAHALFKEEGAHNAVWVWNVNPVSWPAEEWNRIENYYPGDDYVDWVGMTLYGIFWGDYPPREMIPLLYGKYPGKPMMITEVSAADEGNYYGDVVDPWTKYNYTRPLWVSDFFDSLESDFPRVRAFLWFNEWKNISTEADWRLTAEPYPETLDVFRDRIADERYVSEVR